MQDFRNLKVWEKAHSLTLDVYKVTKLLPREEIYVAYKSDSKGVSFHWRQHRRGCMSERGCGVCTISTDGGRLCK